MALEMKEIYWHCHTCDKGTFQLIGDAPPLICYNCNSTSIVILYPPTQRSDCIDGLRPCPWIRCNHHMFWMLNFPWYKTTDEEKVDRILSLEGRTSCVLDMVDGGPSTLEEIGNIMSLTRERVRQIEGTSKKGGALNKMRHMSRSRKLRPYYNEME